ncbi:MAG: Crp/Fnr family transcriptional regulator [Deltaproteobacteria bacterium]|nr:MAG: Crp/Fnr family transcriptional regulator [Deltaproteobacteria bacterium]
MTPIYVLKKIPLFASLPYADQENLVSLIRRKAIRKGELLFRQGDEGTALYIILEGRIKISVSRRTDTVTLAILGQGEFLGEMALLDDLPRSADAMALEDSQLYALSRKDFLSFLKNNENAVHAVLTALSLRLRKTDNLLAEMCFLNLSVRLVNRLVELAEPLAVNETKPQVCTIKISQQELGDILGVSRESINKELKILRSKGYVSTSRNSILIHDLRTFLDFKSV